MTHDTKVVEQKQVSSELVSYRIVCCGETCGPQCTASAHKCSDSWHTIHVQAPNHQSLLEEQKVRIADTHEAMLQWRKGTKE